MSAKRVLVIQVHPTKEGDSDPVVAYLQQAIEGLIPPDEWRCDRDSAQTWINFEVVSDDVAFIWTGMRAELAKDASLFKQLSARWIVVVQGDQDWDDYKTLAHFDPSVRLHELE